MQTSPLSIIYPDPQHELTKRMNESLTEVKWGCRNGTKCFEMMKLVKEIAENGVKLDTVPSDSNVMKRLIW